MTALLAIFGKLWPYLLPLVVGTFLGGWVVHKVESGEIIRAHNSLASFKAQAEANAQLAEIRADAKTAELQASADATHRAFLQEQSDNAHYRSTHPDAPVRLCLAATDHPGGGKAADTGKGTAAPGAGDVRPVPDGDPGLRAGQGPDLAGLFRRFAARADGVSGQLRECRAQR